MGDYIKREDAIKELKEYFIEHDEEQDEFTRPAATLAANAIIDNIPTADVVDVVRCKDCKHYKTNIPCVGGHYNGCIEWINEGCAAEVNEDDFCSYGEKNE